MNLKIYILVSLIFINCIVAAQQTQNQPPTAQKGNSLNFDGKDDQIRAPYSPLLNINKGTLEATIKIVDSTDYELHTIISKQFAYIVTMHGYRLATYDWKEQRIYAYGPSLNDNKWHHVAFVFQDGVKNSSQLYLDGQAVGLPFTYHIFNQTGQIDIGGNNYLDQFFNGCIDEVRIWKRPLSLAEIKQNATTEISKYSKDLILYYKFNDGIASGNNSSILKVYDETINKMDGYFFNFTLNKSVSNYTSETVIKPYNDIRFVSFIIDQRWIIFWSFIVFVGAFSFFRFRTKYLVNQNKKLEKIIVERTKQLDEMLIEKDILIQEIHHRVKNNLQIISTMMQLELENDRTPEQQKPLLETARRLQCMSLVHQQLYRVENLEKINAQQYIETLVTNINEMVNAENKTIAFTLNIASVDLLITKCLPIGFIISEMVSNAIQHAFSNISNHSQIAISLVEKEKDFFQLIVKDNGVGVSIENLNEIKNRQFTTSLGLRLVEVFANQLDAKISFIVNDGFGVNLNFKI